MFVGKGKGEKKTPRICMYNHFQNIFPKISGGQPDLNFWLSSLNFWSSRTRGHANFATLDVYEGSHNQ